MHSERDLDHRRGPELVWFSAASGPRRTGCGAVVLVLHGGHAFGTRRVRRWYPVYLRAAALAHVLARANRSMRVVLLRNRVLGWNQLRLDALHDGRWALQELRQVCPHAPIVIVGHSLGGRVALRLASEPGVVGVCALAPWVEPDEPSNQLVARRALIVHGGRDQWTDPAASRAFAVRAGVMWREVPASGHAMVRQHGEWTALVLKFVRDVSAAATADLDEIRASDGISSRRAATPPIHYNTGRDRPN